MGVMYARCRNALQRTPVSRRLLRRLPLLAGLVLGIILWTASRLHSGSPIIPLSLLGVKNEPSPEPPRERPRLPGTDRPTWALGMCNVPEIEFLRRPSLGLTSNIVYTRRCVKPVRGKGDRDVVESIPRPLITTKTPVNLTDCSRVELPPCDPISLRVSEAYPEKQYPHLIFGVASSYRRLYESLPAFAHWLSSTGAQLLAVVADADDAGNDFDLGNLEAEYQRWGIQAKFVPPTLKMKLDENGMPIPIPIEHHHFYLVHDLAAFATPGKTRWIGVLDDDTFFPSLYTLDQELARHDHTKPVWLGALSDDFNSVRAWGFMAFGGAGAFLSPPLTNIVAAHSEQCLNETTTITGDGMLRDCISTHSRARLELVYDLNQNDLRGDVSGFFESGLQPLSLHHWKSWFQAPVVAMARVATKVCGDCFLQRWRFGNDTVLSNGYSVAVYADGVLPQLDLDRVEGTWEHPTRDFDPTYGVLRPKLDSTKKKSYLLREAVMEELQNREGAKRKVFRQLYVYRDLDDEWAEDKPPVGVDEVMELFWEL